MKSGILKRSVVIGGHKTSVSLEQSFWDALKAIANERHMSVANLVHEVDERRVAPNLSSAVRVYVLEYYKATAAHVAGPLTKGSLNGHPDDQQREQLAEH